MTREVGLDCRRAESIRARVAALVIVGGLALAVVGAASEPQWFVVAPAELASIEGVPVHAVCFSGTPPKERVKAELELPPRHPWREGGGVLIAHALINARGLVVKAQVLKGPDEPETRDAVARCLAQWRFEPAVDREGKPAAVHFLLALPVAPGGGAAGAAPGRGGSSPSTPRPRLLPRTG